VLRGAPLWRGMPNGWLENPAKISLPILTEDSSWMAPGAGRRGTASRVSVGLVYNFSRAKFSGESPMHDTDLVPSG